MARYPDRNSASIPALWAVQERYGWCTPEGIRQAAAVMRVTPAYLEWVASFYDLLHTEARRRAPDRGLHQHQLLDARRRRAAGRLPRRGRRRGRIFVTGFECLGACDIAPMASIDQRYFGPLLPGEAGRAIDQLLRRRRGPAGEIAGEAAAGRRHAPEPPAAGGND